MNAAGGQGGQPAAMPPPGPTQNIHHTYHDLYSDPAWDTFHGNYVNFYHEYTMAGVTPATLRDN